MDAGRANKEAEILRKQCKALCQELKEALQEADVAKCRRDWAFQERDKIVAERDSIRYGAPGLPWALVSHDAPGWWGGPELFAVCPGKVGMTWILPFSPYVMPLPCLRALEFSIKSLYPISLHPRCLSMHYPVETSVK